MGVLFCFISFCLGGSVTSSGHQAGITHKDSPASASCVLGLQVCSTMTALSDPIALEVEKSSRGVGWESWTQKPFLGSSNRHVVGPR